MTAMPHRFCVPNRPPLWYTQIRLMKARITVMPKKTVLDPQGKTVKHALETMQFRGIKDVRIGKFLEIELADGDPAAARRQLDEACAKLLSNPVIEEYTLEIQ